jgi:hypothetical protein
MHARLLGTLARSSRHRQPFPRRRFLATALLHVFTGLPNTDCGGYWQGLANRGLVLTNTCESSFRKTRDAGSHHIAVQSIIAAHELGVFLTARSNLATACVIAPK